MIGGQLLWFLIRRHREPDVFGIGGKSRRLQDGPDMILTRRPYSGISCKGSMGLIKVKALSIIWYLTLREWSKGELIDDNALLAKLNKRLSIAEKLYKII